LLHAARCRAPGRARGRAILILLVIFGFPDQMATVLPALAGASLTVALKISSWGFFGWFVLTGGKNGIRQWRLGRDQRGQRLKSSKSDYSIPYYSKPGNWNDSGYPTGRRVTFVNKLCHRGPLFQLFRLPASGFGTELQIALPADQDPYPIVDRVAEDCSPKKLKQMRALAEQEWGASG